MESKFLTPEEIKELLWSAADEQSLVNIEKHKFTGPVLIPPVVAVLRGMAKWDNQEAEIRPSALMYALISAFTVLAGDDPASLKNAVLEARKFLLGAFWYARRIEKELQMTSDALAAANAHLNPIPLQPMDDEATS